MINLLYFLHTYIYQHFLNCFQVHVVPYLLSYTQGPLRTGLGGATPPDVFVCAPTGCGKTLCYALPIVKSLMHRVVTQVNIHVHVCIHVCVLVCIMKFNFVII